MKTIKKENLDFINMKRIYVGEDAKTYRDDEMVYKLFDNPEDPFTKDHALKARRIQRYRKYLDKHIILPKDMIISGNMDAGYSSKYIKDSQPLYNFQIDSSATLKLFYSFLYDICKLLKNLHDNGIIVSDFHFHNVLFKKDNVFMVDFDNIKIEELFGYTPSFLLYAFTKTYDIPFSFETISEETDKLSLLLSTLQMFCREKTIILTDARYTDLCEKYILVNNIVVELRRIIKQRKIANVPLPSEIICLKKRPF